MQEILAVVKADLELELKSEPIRVIDAFSGHFYLLNGSNNPACF